MTYYLLLPKDTEHDALFSTNVLGEESFGSFYPDQGLEILMNMAEKEPAILEHIKIKDDQNQTHTILEFLEHIGNLNVRKM